MYKFLVEKNIFTISACELFKVKIKIVNNTRNTYVLGQNASKYRRQINSFCLCKCGSLKCTQRVAMVSNQEVTLTLTLSFTKIGIIYNKITHLVLTTRQIEHILININTSLRSRKMLEKLYKMS